MRNYPLANLSLDAEYERISYENKSLKLIEQTAKGVGLKELLGTKERPKITIIKNIFLNNKLFYELMDTKEPLDVDYQLATIETSTDKVILCFAHAKKDKSTMLYNPKVQYMKELCDDWKSTTIKLFHQFIGWVR